MRQKKVIVNKIIPSQKIAAIPPLKSPAVLYASLYSTGSRSSIFMSSEYDLVEVGKVQDVESYVMQSFIKKEGLMVKEGWNFTGPNPKTIKYIKDRLSQISQASGTSTSTLIQKICSSLVQKSNAFLVKVRDENASGGMTRNVPGTSRQLKPVAAYFPIPAETMKFKLDLSGRRVVKWQHYVEGNSNDKEFVVDDVVHFPFNRKDGFVFGTPTVIPVLDDIRALRKIEENVELLIYQHAFPLFHYTVGTENAPAGITEDGRDEIEVAKGQVRLMPSEGGIVTSERHKLELLGTQGRVITVDAYLAYFKQRVFSGLSMSAIDFGEPGAANRSTAETISGNLVDAIKSIQKAVEDTFDTEIIKELLLESDFDFDPLLEENMVHLRFNEIDIDAEIKKNNHHTDLFLKNIETHSEARMAMGKEPLKIPTRKEMRETDDSLEAKYPEWYQLYWKLIEEPKITIQAVDEAWNLNNVVQSNTPTATTEPKIQKRPAETAQKQAGSTPKTIKNTSEDRNENPGAPKPYNPHIVKRCMKDLEQYLIALVESKVASREQMDMAIRHLFSRCPEELTSFGVTEFRAGYDSVNKNMSQYAGTLAEHRSQIRIRDRIFSERLMDDMLEGMRFVNDANGVKMLMSSLYWRADLIDYNEAKAAKVLGMAMGLKDAGKNKLIVTCGQYPCDDCFDAANDRGEIDFSNITNKNLYEKLPPFHPRCSCGVKAKNEVNNDNR